MLTILTAWAVLAALVALLFAAVGRSARREDEDLGHLPATARPDERATADARTKLREPV